MNPQKIMLIMSTDFYVSNGAAATGASSDFLDD
jgi:hypothetical protein